MSDKHNHSSNFSGRPATDLVDPVLRSLWLTGIKHGRRRLEGSWAYSFPEESNASFHFIAGQGCWLFHKAHGYRWLEAGDAILLPRGDAHVLARTRQGVGPGTPAFRCEADFDDPIEFQNEHTNDTCLMFYGTMRFNLDRLHPLIDMMPSILHAGSLMRDQPAIPALIDAMGCELQGNRLGSGAIVSRLADVLAAQIIRSWVELGYGDVEGWAAASRDPNIGRVLAAIHSDPGQDWSILRLAQVMGASRSLFAHRFKTVVGETPAQYVARIRMHLAHKWLADDGERVTVVYERLGYHSEPAFSRAFKRVMGFAPSQSRRRRQGRVNRDQGGANRR
ncbi:AraC family transcriptional regulator [Salinicola corii]|uniref:AraC family transcriptional regulator n=2 Tax=Salinicola corii TaxID=2606937 RepID=A0A640WK12_9GAMM|nr:AraC family transcriptional regulator [Salinicola corii]